MSSEPKRFLFVVWEGGGTVPPEMDLAKQLLAQGHEVRVLADPCLEEDVLKVGCSFVPYKKAPHRFERKPETDLVKSWALKNPLKIYALQRDRLLFGPALQYAEDVLDVLETYPADVLVVDYILYGAMVAGEKAGLPTAVMITRCYLTPAPGMPAPGLGLMPNNSLYGKIRDAVVNAVARRLHKTGTPQLNQARNALGLDSISHPHDQVERMDRVLVLTSEAFDFVPSQLPHNVRYVGPQLQEPAWVQEWESPWPEEDKRPLVVVGFTTAFQDQQGILQRVADVLSELPVRGLITLGPILKPGSVKAKDNVVVVQSAPHNVVFAQADLVITHAGHGTVIRALAHGVPMVCIPMGNDQFDTAARVQYRGAGVKLPVTASAQELKEATQKVLGDKQFRLSAQHIAEAIRAEIKEGRAVKELEALADMNKQTTPQRVSN